MKPGSIETMLSVRFSWARLAVPAGRLNVRLLLVRAFPPVFAGSERVTFGRGAAASRASFSRNLNGIRGENNRSLAGENQKPPAIRIEIPGGPGA